MIQVRYLCSNPGCLFRWHYGPGCPYRRPESPGPITENDLRAIRHLRQLERDGVLEPVRPLGLRWLWALLAVLAVLLLLILL